jgi:hypothetical protein
MNRFNINTWNVYNITPGNIAYAQWYRLHDDKTLMMLNFLEYKYPYHTILQIHDKYLQHYLYDPKLLFSLHEKCSFAMTLYYSCCLDFNDLFCFNETRYKQNKIIERFLVDTEVSDDEKDIITLNIEYNLDRILLNHSSIFALN